MTTSVGRKSAAGRGHFVLGQRTTETMCSCHCRCFLNETSNVRAVSALQPGGRRQHGPAFRCPTILNGVGNSDYSGRSFREVELDFLRRSHADGSKFWDLIPAVLVAGELTFEERRIEYEALGFVCAEGHRGNEQELFDSGITRFCTDENCEVIAARCERQTKPND